MNIEYKYLTGAIRNEVISFRRDFHKHPEEGFTEYYTSCKIAELLKSYGYEVIVGKKVCKAESRMGVPSFKILEECENRALSEGANSEYLGSMKGGQTGVIGIIKGDLPGKITALRFDIDALPIDEKTKLSFASIHKNVMHACGHDGHASAGLGVAKCIAWNKKKLKGEVRIIFQPAEEGCRGSQSIVDAGWLDNVDVFLSGHIGINCKKLGQIYACNSGFMATTKYNLTFHGISAHAGKVPEVGRNALLAAAVFTQNAYAVSRTSKGDTRLNVGKFISGTGRNIIADTAYLELETRGNNSETNIYMEESIKRIADAAAAMYDVNYDILKVGSSNSAVSSEKLVSRLEKQAKAMDNSIDYKPSGHMGASEDAVAMINHVQRNGGEAAYYLFGSELAGEHHQDTFDFNEEVLSVIVEFLSRAVLD